MNVENRPHRGFTTGYSAIVVIAALCSIAATVVLADSSAEEGTKTQGFSAIAAIFLITWVGLHLWRAQTPRLVPAEEAITDAADEALAKLDHAGEFFARSIKTADVFRLIANHVRQAVPAKTMVLFLLDDTRLRLEAVEMDGATPGFAAESFGADQCFVKRSLHVTERGVVAIPLLSDYEPFGVLELHFDPVDLLEKHGHAIFDAIGTRVAPLILNSLAFERTVSNALIDVTTELPNERALYLILENQIAESQRKRGERPLALLSIDIRGFDEINQKFGHAAGDRALTFVANVVRDNLRQMDFLARCSNDEFLAVLPTASREISQEVIARITTSLFGRRFNISEQDPVEIELCFGWAAFGEDGETADHLITAARVRKERSKSPGSGKVLWFSKETVS